MFVNWFERLTKITSNADNSPELKKGEIRSVLIQMANEIFPDFKFLTYKNYCYYFQRIRQVNDYNVYETFHVIFSLKDKNFACSVSSSLNKEHIFSNQYNTSLLYSHKDLKVLKHNAKALNIQNAYYFHNGRLETTTKIIKELFEDYKKYGLPFLDKQFKNLQSNQIIKRGFEYIDKLKVDKENLKMDILEDLDKGRHLLSSIKNPIYLDLKEKLYSIKEQNKEDRQKILKTANEFLELYWSR